MRETVHPGGLFGSSRLDCQEPYQLRFISQLERAWLGDQLAGAGGFVPHIPQQHAAHPLFTQIIYHAFLEWLFPISDRRQGSVQLVYRLIPQLEQVGVEVRQMEVRLAADQPDQAMQSICRIPRTAASAVMLAHKMMY